MKYAIIPILKEIDVFGQAYEELYPEPPTNQVMHQRSAEIALYLIMIIPLNLNMNLFCIRKEITLLNLKL